MLHRLDTVLGLASAALVALLTGSCSAGKSTDAVLREPDPRSSGCEPVSVYGPKPCRSDGECVEENGEGWYCDTDHSYSDGCGGRIEWPVCRQR